MSFPKPERVTDRKLLAHIKTLKCCVCGGIPSDPSHIRTRGAGGPDEIWNVVPHCRSCHIVWGRVGAWRFCQKHPKFKRHLESLGWYWDGLKLRHPNLEKGVA